MSLRSRLAALAAAAVLMFAPFSSLPAVAQADPGTELSPGAVLPLDLNTCPPEYPVKGNRAGRQASRPVDPIYHVTGGRYYDVTDPEECFATAADAEAAGYRAPLR